jgi:tRNA A37 threonylcarbamoyladenosine dehydratase
MNMETDTARRFGGLERLFGTGGAAAIRAASVAVVGIGGVGSWAAEALARSGVGQITLIDMDHIAESNINRQIHALQHTLGQSKIAAMAERITAINPHCQLQLVDDFVEPDNWPQLLPTPVDAVIDACDQMKAKVAMAAWARRHKTGLIVVGAAGGKRQAQAVEVADLSATTHDPLLAQLRYRLRREHQAPRSGRIGIHCVYSKEAVAQPDASCAVAGDGSLNCSGYGSAVSVTATFGMVAAGWLLDQLASGRR